MSTLWGFNRRSPSGVSGARKIPIRIFRSRFCNLTDRLRPLLTKVGLGTRRIEGHQPDSTAPDEDRPFLRAYFANIVELSEDAIISVDADHRIRLFNKGAEATFGYQAGEMLGRSLDALLPPRYQSIHRAHITRFAESADTLRPMNERGPIVGVRKDGTEFPAEATISKFTVKGETVVSVRLRDITERKRSEVGLQRLAAIVESSDDAIVGMARDGTVITWNAGAERLYGYAVSEVLGRHIALLAPPDGQDEMRRLLERVLQGESVNNYETEQLTRAFIRIIVSLSISPIRDSAGSIIGMSAIGRDATQRKRFETQLRQAQKLEAIGTLAGGIAHDFNNLLNLLSGHAELAAIRLPTGSPAREHLQEILAASERATHLVRQILAFSRRSEHERGPVALQTVVDDLKRLLRASLPATIEFRQHMDAAPATVLADPQQIHQVLLNLCANAAHAMRNRGGVLDIHLRTVNLDAKFTEAHPPLQPGPHVKLTIRDTGHGMPSDVMERIFEPFFTTKPAGEGTGLGLAVVHGIVASHDGAITIESAPGRGTRFDLYFPRCDDMADSLPPPRAPLQGHGERILLVDDEESLVRLWTITLTDLGYRVTAFTNSRAALEAFRETPDAIDLVITDQTMPQMSGEVLAKKLLQLRPRLPIILCTGHFQPPAGPRPTPLGVRATLMKPISRLDLSLAIHRLLTEPAATHSNS